LRKALRQFNKQEGVALFPWRCRLYRNASPLHGAGRPGRGRAGDQSEFGGVRSLIGFFVNTLVLRLPVEAG